MTAITRVLCPVDFSDCSRHALDQAAAISNHYTAALRLLHVLRPVESMIPAGDGGLYPGFVYTEEDVAQFARELTAFAADAGATKNVDTFVVEGNPAREIVRDAAESHADLIVIGTHGRTGFQRLLLGSVAEHVLVKAPCPVLTVPQRAADVVPAGGVLFRQIVCAVDFSPAAKKALAYAQALAAEFEAALTVVHVVDPVPVFDPVLMGGPGMSEFTAQATAIARDYFHEWLRRNAGGETPAEVVVEGKAYQEILRTASDRRADLIVLGAHAGRAGLLAFGSTMNHVVRQATCPVLTLKP